ncbi:ParB N-terminal domain-containing protein [Streptomyces achromogenes]|uniref:ParB N-terminal domain-containing protein n=1 Tax=Streptomyces achromogenes TaxID=67255 RepID=UPI0036F806BC
MSNASRPDTDDQGAAREIARRISEIRRSPVEQVLIDDLRLTGSPRSRGEDSRHVRLLGEADTELPPIVVHRATMRVVDGAHRVRAASLRGLRRIGAQFFEGGEEEAYLLSVALNTAHGLTLSRTDRTAAALRILATHPCWSDRSVAAVAGISASKVARLREGAAATGVRTRIGRDGRSRPVDPAAGRARAGELLRQDPTASLRQVARAAGISPATAADVRDRLLRGADPLPDRLRRAAERAAQRPGHRAGPADGEFPRTAPASPEALTRVIDTLCRDPSLRLTSTGREVLRLLRVCATAVRDQRRIVTSVPPHCLAPLAELMRGYSGIWQSLAEELERAHSASTRDLTH